MRYQSILGNCNETTIGSMIEQCPETSTVFQQYRLNVSDDQNKTVHQAAQLAGIEGKTLCRQLFDVCMEHKPLEEIETDTLLELLGTEYNESHLSQLPGLHRLARKIEAVHRTSSEVPRGITRIVKQLEQAVTDHVRRVKTYRNEEHNAIRQQLRNLRELTQKYQPPETACRSWRRLYEELKSLDFSLSEQIYLERDILFPRFQS